MFFSTLPLINCVCLIPQMCADLREAGEHPCGAAESVPGHRKGHAGGAHRRDEGL